VTVAIASGKGGTGKTTVAVNLALTLGGRLQFLDCDVEEPNAHLFVQPKIGEVRPVQVLVPQVNEELCTACGACSRACRYHAIVSLKTKPLVFPELCHGCGGCALACEAGAIRETPREVGVIERGLHGEIRFASGRLNVGEAMAGPVIRALKSAADRSLLTIIDAPPGTSCPVVASVRESDFVVLVTEPTPFGLNDLALAVGMVRELQQPFGVVINRSDIGDDAVREYCEAEGIPLLLEIPEDRRVAEAYSRGEPAIQAVPAMRESFERLYENICREQAHQELRQYTEEGAHADV
jgi:MinD superfamily P-loop ATPase